MLAFAHLRWNVTTEEWYSLSNYFSDLSVYASALGFVGGENTRMFGDIWCDFCQVIIPMRHIFLMSREDSERRWCYECMEDEYRRNGVVEDVPGGVVARRIERPEVLARFEDKGDG